MTEQSPIDKLLPCPFCGGNNVSAHMRDHRPDIDCLDCDTITTFYVKDRSKEGAIAAWNTRAQSGQQQSGISVVEVEKSVSEMLHRLLVNEAIDCLTINIEQIAMLLRPYLRTDKPVSLEKCARAVEVTFHKYGTLVTSRIAKAVLDAAGVPYE